MFDQILFMIKALYLSVVMVVLLILLFFALFVILNTKLKFGNKLVQILGIFSGLNMKEKLKLTTTTLKLFFILSMLIQIKNIELIHFVACGEIIIANAILYAPDVFAIKEFIFDAALLCSIVLLNVLCSFINSTGSKIAFIIVLVFACIFVFIFEYYRFLDEINYIARNKKGITNEETN